MNADKIRKTRVAYRGVLTKRLQALSETVSQKKIEDLPSILDRIMETEQRIDEIQSQLENELEEDELVRVIEEYNDWKDEIRSECYKARRLLDEQDASVSSMKSSSRGESIGRGTVRLPKLSLPVFSGNLLEWQLFYDSFLSSVHSRTDLSEIDKFNYLKSQLTGSALDVIKGFSLSAENYGTAFELLCERFGKKQLIIRAHIKALLNLPSVQSGSLKSLSNFINTVEISVRSLNGLGISNEEYSCFLTQIVLFRLPEEINVEYARFDRTGESSITDLLKFLNEELNILRSSKEYCDRALPKSHRSPATTVNHVSTKSKLFCSCCKGNHWLDQCPKFLALSVDDRRSRPNAKSNQLCFNCLKKHFVKDCKSLFSCKKCGKKHHTLLHAVHVEGNSDSDPTPTQSISCSSVNRNNCSVLSTALVRVNGSSKLYRVLFDSGSQLSYVRLSVMRELKLRTHETTELSIAGFGETTSLTEKFPVVELNLSNRFRSNSNVKMKCIAVERLCSSIQCPDLSSILPEICAKQQLADDDSVSSKTIHIIIGIDYLHEILHYQTSYLSDGLCLTESLFGLVIHGRVSNKNFKSQTSCNLIQATPPRLDVFWETERMGIESFANDDSFKVSERQALDQFNSTVEFKDNRYEVSLPWKEEFIQVPNCKQATLNRTCNVIRKLKHDPATLQAYHSVFVEYRKLGMIEPVVSEDGNVVRYLPHRPVIRDDKLTSKVRPVFDASAIDEDGISLNDLILPGPNLLPNLFDILIRFRAYPVSLIADIEKAFLQISVRQEDRDALRFFWFNVNDPTAAGDSRNLLEYRWTRLPFGLTSSPFLLQAVVRYHLERFKNQEVCQSISENIYVDDVVLSVNDENKAAYVKTEAQGVFNQCSMNLRKWSSNVPSLNEDVNSEATKILGLPYEPTSDVIKITAPKFLNEFPTKRQVLQSIASIFDPLGLFAPVVTTLKLFFQRIIQLNIEWDDRIPNQLAEEWVKLMTQLKELKNVSVERCVHFEGDVKLHMFCDASMKAYGAVIYVVDISGQYRLLTAKSKLSPSKNVTLPRLELMAACLGSKLLKNVCSALKVSSNEALCWSDSKIVLAWINHKTADLKQFVSNRVHLIQSNTNAKNWNYVRSKDNPADLVSRGTTVLDLQESDLWWHGTHSHETKIPHLEEDEIASVEMEVRKNSPNRSTVNATFEIENSRISNVVDVSRFSNWNKLLRVTMKVLLFIRNCRRTAGLRALTKIPSDLESAERLWIRDMQAGWNSEITLLQEDKPLNDSKLNILSPYIDPNGLLRSRGRLQNADLTENAKCPLILNNPHPALRLLILSYHSKTMHGGLQTVACQLRQRFVFFKMLRTVRSCIRNCVICRKAYLQSYCQPTPSLPKFRVNAGSRVFEAIGLDYTGPLYVKENGQVVKTYILLITCAVFRAVHLELVQDLSYPELMNALSIFFARRGVPRLIFSDNAKSFLKAKSVLTETNEIEWKTIPERAPWYGGFWERLMSVIKNPLRRTL